MLSKLHMCTTHTHTDTPGSHSPLLSTSRLSGPWAGLLRQLPSLSTKDGRSQPLCRELAFCMPLILGRGSRWHRTALFLSEILRRVHSGTPNLVMEFASATKGVWSPVYPKLSTCFDSPGPPWRQHQTLSFWAWQEGWWGGRGHGWPPPNPLSFSSRRQSGRGLGEEPKGYFHADRQLSPAGWESSHRHVRTDQQPGEARLADWATAAGQLGPPGAQPWSVEPESHPRPSWCARFFVCFFTQPQKEREKERGRGYFQPLLSYRPALRFGTFFPTASRMGHIWFYFCAPSSTDRRLALATEPPRAGCSSVPVCCEARSASCLPSQGCFGREKSLWVLR